MFLLPVQQYISFDIFDTLIKRSVARPTDLFCYMEKYCQYNNISIPSEFAKKRVEAEITARREKNGEVTIDDIYRELHTLSSEMVSELQSVELSLELSGCRANPPIADFFRKCVQVGKTVVLISDMYLSSAFISKMLAHCGIYGYKKIYVSCEHGASKGNGLIFSIVLEEMGIRPDMLFHIGDNRRSDYIVPLSLGIHAHYIKNMQNKLCRVPKSMEGSNALVYRTISTCFNNCAASKTQFGRMGAQTFGPILVGFSIWLKDQLKRDGIRDVYFMSRDGYMLQRAFEILEIPEIKTHYLYCSRRAYTVPLLWKYSSLEDIFHNITFNGEFALSTFIIRVGLSPEDCVKEAKECGLDMENEFSVEAFTQNTQSRNFYEKIRGKVISNSKNEYDALLSYILSLKMKNRIGVVDIGYCGTMQNALEQVIKEANLGIAVKGYYVMVSPQAEIINKKEICALGYLCEKGRNEQIMMNIPLRIFELMFLAQHGSVKRFCDTEGYVSPEFYEYEYSIKSDEIKNLIEFQDGAIDFAHEYIRSFSSKSFPIEPQPVLCNLYRMTKSPVKAEANFWGDFQFVDVTTTLLAKPKSLLYYLFHWKELLLDYKRTRWKVGFLYRLVGIPLPYSDLLYYARTVKHLFKSMN